MAYLPTHRLTMSYHAFWVPLSPKSPFLRCVWVMFSDSDSESQLECKVELSNLHPLSTAASIAEYFETYGPIQDAYVDGTGYGSIVFVNSEDCRQLHDEIVVRSGEQRRREAFHIEQGGVSAWLSAYHQKYRQPVEQLKAKIERDVAAYDEEVEREAEAAKSARVNADEDGWVTVQPKKKGRGSRQTHIGGGMTMKPAAIVDPEAMKARLEKEKEKVLKDFYKFQKAEKQGKAVEDLRAKFEQDKLKLAEMRRKRKFNPV